MIAASAGAGRIVLAHLSLEVHIFLLCIEVRLESRLLLRRLEPPEPSLPQGQAKAKFIEGNPIDVRC